MKVYKERRFLSRSMRDVGAAVNTLDKIMLIAALLVLFFSMFTITIVRPLIDLIHYLSSNSIAVNLQCQHYVRMIYSYTIDALTDGSIQEILDIILFGTFDHFVISGTGCNSTMCRLSLVLLRHSFSRILPQTHSMLSCSFS